MKPATDTPAYLKILSASYESLICVEDLGSDDSDAVDILTLFGAFNIINLFLDQAAIPEQSHAHLIQTFREGTSRTISDVCAKCGLNESRQDLFTVNNPRCDDAIALRKYVLLLRVEKALPQIKELYEAHIYHPDTVEENSSASLLLDILSSHLSTSSYIAASQYQRQQKIQKAWEDATAEIDNKYSALIQEFIAFVKDA